MKTHYRGLAALALLSMFGCKQQTPPAATDIALPGDTAYPENVTASADGTLYTGSFSAGGVLRIKPGLAPEMWIKPGAFDTRSVLGLLVDERAGLLWLCSNDTSAIGVAGPSDVKGAHLKGFDLKTGEGKVSAALPGEATLCNDIAVDAAGGVYVTNTMAPEVLKLSADRKTLEVWKRDEQLAPPAGGGGGLDGIVFGSDGNMLVNTFGGGELFRIAVKDGVAGEVTKLKTSRALKFPDVIRQYGAQQFLMIEGGGSLDLVRIDGDTATISTIKDGWFGPTGVVQVGDTLWVSEGQLPFILDPSLKGKSPKLPFKIYAVAKPALELPFAGAALGRD